MNDECVSGMNDGVIYISKIILAAKKPSMGKKGKKVSIHVPSISSQEEFPSLGSARGTTIQSSLVEPSLTEPYGNAVKSSTQSSSRANFDNDDENIKIEEEKRELNCLPQNTWCIRGTKGAKIPLQVEKRKHKTVTMLRNIEGDIDNLLLELKRALGTGGKVVASLDDMSCCEIEIQGDHFQRIATFLVTESIRYPRCLRGIARTEIDGAQPKNKQAATNKSKSIARLDKKAASLKQSGR